LTPNLDNKKTPHNQNNHHHPISSSSKSSCNEQTADSELQNLSEIERRAREQERELQLELQSLGHHDRAQRISRPGSSSSIASSNTDGNGNASVLSTSRSVDFQNVISSISDVHRANMDSPISLTDDFLNPMFSTRLPLPRCQAIPGKTAIPAPSAKKTHKSRRARRLSPSNSMSECGFSSHVSSSCGSGPASEKLSDDEECF